MYLRYTYMFLFECVENPNINLDHLSTSTYSIHVNKMIHVYAYFKIHVLPCVLYPCRFVLVHCVQRQAYMYLGYSKFDQHWEIYWSRQTGKYIDQDRQYLLKYVLPPVNPIPTPQLNCSFSISLIFVVHHDFFYFLSTDPFYCQLNIFHFLPTHISMTDLFSKIYRPKFLAGLFLYW